MNAAKKALENSKDLFPQLNHQKRVIAHSLKKQKVTNDSHTGKDEEEKDYSRSRDAKLPKQYQMRDRSISEISSSSFESDNKSSGKRKRKPKKKETKPPRKEEPQRSGSGKSFERIEDEFSSLSDAIFEEFEDDVSKIGNMSPGNVLSTMSTENASFENSVEMFKVHGGEDVSDLESGELS